MKKNKCSFILPTRNVAEYIKPLLTSIFSQDYQGEIEVLIQDSSDDGKTPAIVKQFPVRYAWVEPNDYNYGKTRNEGAALTDSEFLIFLSTDIEITNTKWLSNLTRHFEDSEVAGVYGRQIPRPNATPMEQFFIIHTYPAEKAIIRLSSGKLIRRTTPVFFSNVNSAIRREVWKQIKIPEMLKGEEEEWAKRALIAGYTIVYDTEACVFHSHTYSMKQVFKEYFDTGASFSVTHYNEIVNYRLGSFIVDGLKYIAREYKFMLANRYAHWIPYAIVYDVMKFLGIFLGSQHEHMPIWMKRALCKKKNHWDQYNTIIKEPV